MIIWIPSQWRGNYWRIALNWRNRLCSTSDIVCFNWRYNSCFHGDQALLGNNWLGISRNSYNCCILNRVNLLFLKLLRQILLWLLLNNQLLLVLLIILLQRLFGLQLLRHHLYLRFLRDGLGYSLRFFCSHCSSRYSY